MEKGFINKRSRLQRRTKQASAANEVGFVCRAIHLAELANSYGRVAKHVWTKWQTRKDVLEFTSLHVCVSPLAGRLAYKFLKGAEERGLVGKACLGVEGTDFRLRIIKHELFCVVNAVSVNKIGEGTALLYADTIGDGIA